MTDSSSHGSTAAENSPDPESLTQIEGIGKVKKQWLNSIGINTLQELAEATSQDIEAQLNAEGHTVHVGEVERWITQAQEIMAELAPIETHVPESPVPEETDQRSSEMPLPEDQTSDGDATSDRDATSDQVSTEEVSTEEAEASELITISNKDSDEDSEDGDLEEASDTPQTVTGWQTFAAFAVEFQSQQSDDDTRYQTLVKHLATNQEKTWSGIEEQQLQSWMRSQIAEVIPAEQSSAKDTALEPDAQLTLTIEDLFILQPPTTSTPMGLYKPNMMFPSPIRGNLPFSLVVQFSVKEPETLAKLEQTIAYSVECYARSLRKGEAISLGTVPLTQLLPQHNPYTVHLPAISLPKEIYRLQVFLSLEGIRALPTFLEVPVLQVT